VKGKLYGLMAEFTDHEQVVTAAKQAREAGLSVPGCLHALFQ